MLDDAELAAPTELGMQRRGRLRRYLFGTLGRTGIVIEVVALIVAWQAIVAWLDIGNPNFVPPPSTIWDSFTAMLRQGTLEGDVRYSCINLVIGFAFAAAAGSTFGFLMGASRYFRTIATPAFLTGYAVPAVAIQPLLVLWMGYGRTPKSLIVFLMAFFPIAITVYEGVRGTDTSLVRAARVFGVGKLALQYKILLPAALPFVLVGLELGISRGVVGVVIGEFIGGTQGLGYRLQLAGEQFDVARGLALTVSLVLIANIGVFILRAIKMWVAPWDNTRRRK